MACNYFEDTFSSLLFFIAPPPSSESDSVFHAKPVKVKRSGASGRVTQVVPSVDDDDDVYRAKSETVKAEEVAEDEDTKVDLPVDQVESIFL